MDLRIDGLTCLDCARKVERALRAIPQVRQAMVNYPEARATLTVADTSDLTALHEAATGAVVAAGYRVREELSPTAHTSERSKTELEDTSTGQPMPSVAPNPRQATRSVVGDGPHVDYDLLVIGSGGAGTAAAIRGAELGARLLIIEAAEAIGGTCVNIGCIPSKYLIEAAHHYYAARSGYPAGISGCAPDLAWNQILREKQTVIETLREERYRKVLESYDGLTLRKGRAGFEGPAGDTGREGDRVLHVRLDQQMIRARRVVVATGTSPAQPPIPGLAGVGALDSTSVMELQALPRSLLVIGGGSIGLELGQAFARFGVRVVVLELEDRILPGEDADLSNAVAVALEAEGIEIQTGVRVTAAARMADGVALTTTRGNLQRKVRGEQVLVATGRRPNTAGMGLAAIGVQTDQHGFIKTDGFMRTSHPCIYAAGDVTGGPGYVYVAALQGGIAAQAALAENSGQSAIPIDLSATPRVTFTDPQVAAVGLTPDEARASGYEPKVTILPVETLPRAAVSYRRRGVIKLVADQASDRLLGAHVVAANAGDIIGEAALAIKFTLTAQNLVSTLHPYLTWGEGLKLAAQTFTKDIAKLSCCA